MYCGVQNCATELTFESGRDYHDPLRDVMVEATFTRPDGNEQVVPCFWAGERTWRVRYAPPQVGTYRYRTTCSDHSNPDLHGREGTLEVAPYTGSNPLLRHGRLRVSADRRHLEHADGTPFLWLGDTWWMGFTRRLEWPGGFQELVADRVAKGFSVIQIVAGLYPDMEPFDERGANEAGFPWLSGFTQINPSYFDMADLRIAALVRAGLVPCIVGMWGYYLDFAGRDVVERHWRYLVARWGAYPVVWCVAGEALMPFYLRRFSDDAERQAWEQHTRRAWAEIARGIRAADPFGNPITIHPTRYGHEQVDDRAVLDVDMLQTGHSGHASLGPTVDMLSESLGLEPPMPVLVGEVNYEGIIESAREEMQRFQFWACMLSGAAGHTYGANGIWQVNTRAQPYGPSPHGTAWGNLPWEDAYRLPGSRQIGLGKRLLERYEWWRLEPHPEWIEPHQTPEDRLAPYATGIPGHLRLIYIPAPHSWTAWSGRLIVKELEAGLAYRALLFDPKSGEEHALGMVMGDAAGEWRVPKPPVFQDYVVVLERE